jgi:hypothetical protein
MFVAESDPIRGANRFLEHLGISAFQVLGKKYLISKGKLTTGGTAYFLTRPDAPGMSYLKTITGATQRFGHK